MILTLHILIALSSLLFASYTLYQPSKNKLLVSYTLIISTLASGSYLTILTPSHMVQSCVAGLIYTGAVFMLIAFARQKLASTSLLIDRSSR